MPPVLQDIRLAIRMLLQNRASTTVAVLTLALGIGANTAIFSIVDGVLLRPAPVQDIERLGIIWETDRNTATTREPASLPDFEDYQARSRTFETIAALMAEEVNLTPIGGEPVRLAGLKVTHELLPMLGLRTLVGRHFTAQDDRPGAPSVALISESLWRRSYEASASAVGQDLRIDDRAVSIIGVVPDASDFGVLQTLSAAAYSRSFADRDAGARVDVWAPLPRDVKAMPRATHPIFMVGRLAPATTFEAAQEEMAAISADLERSYEENDGRGVHVESMEQVVFGPVRPALYLLLGTVGLVLLVACINVSNLLLARGTGRVREIAVRTALGASARSLARQFLIENLVLTLVASAAGVALAFVGLQLLVALAPAGIPRLMDVAVDMRVLLTTLAVSVVAGIAFGMVPTLQALRVDVQGTIKSAGGPQGSGGPDRGRLRGALVVAEFALAVMLLAGAGLLIKSFWRLQQVDPGFSAGGVLKAEYQLPGSRYPVNFSLWPNFKEMHTFNAALLQRAAALPGVVSAAIAGNHPLDPGFTNSFGIVGREAESKAWPEISIRRVTPGYFRTVGLSLMQGRLLDDTDTTASAPAIVLNQAAVARFFSNRDPLGAQFRFWGGTWRVVGVVANEKFQGLTTAAPIALYVSLQQAPSTTGAGVLLVRTNSDPGALTSAARGAIRAIDPGLAVFGVEPLQDTLSRSMAQQRFTMQLLATFAGVALILAAIGIHGVLSYTVAQRRREIGIRLALGAQPERVQRLVVRQGLTLSLVGLGIGLAGALLVTRLLDTLLYGVTATDPGIFLVIPVVLIGVAAAASYLPARRAARLDPIVALRTD